MLELKQLQFSGIGRFVEEQSIDFSSLDEFIQVDGQNNNTKGSSGSGKTTVFNALDYLLGLNDIPSTILQSRFTENHITVSGLFLWNGQEVTISRGKKLGIAYAEKTIKGSSALAEEEIDKILGMERKIFRKLLHKRQKEGGFFLDFTPAKTHEFLIDCLNLSEFKKHDERMNKKIADLVDKKTKEEASLNGQEVGLSATKESTIALGIAPIKDIHQDMVLSLKNKVEEAENTLRTITTQHNLSAIRLDKERPETIVVPFDRSALDSYEKTKNNLATKLVHVDQQEQNRISKVKSAIVLNEHARKQAEGRVVARINAQRDSLKIAEEIKKIRSSICPTCTQTWITEQYGKQERERIKQLLQLKTIVDSGLEASQELESIEILSLTHKEELIPRIDPQIAEIKGHIENITVRMSDEKKKEQEWVGQQNANNSILNENFAQKQKNLRDTQSMEANQARGQLDIDRRIFDGAIAKLRSYEEARTRYETSLASLKDKEEKFTNKIAEIKKNILQISAELLLAEETRKAIKTYLSYSFDDALEEIGARATEIIRCIPNTSNATIQFDGTKETKDGKVKEEVNAVLGMDGEEAVPIKSLSGGERTAVDLAVDLAVIDFIETKSGKGINIFVLDEPFTGLGSVEIEMALEVLKNSNTNKKIIIVDHNSEVKQMVQNRLVVVREGLTSNMEKNTDV